MGLAASQARLLFITSRQNDVSAKMQRISNQTMILARDSEEVSDKYNRMLNEKTYKLRDDVSLSYDSLMGGTAINSLGQVNIVTNQDGKVVLSSADKTRYGITSDIGNPKEFKDKIHKTVDDFIRQADPTNADAIIAAKPNTTQSGGGNVYGSLTEDDIAKIKTFTGTYGEYPAITKQTSIEDLVSAMGSGSVSAYGGDSSTNAFNNVTMTQILNGQACTSVEIASDGDRSGVPADQAAKNIGAVGNMMKDMLLKALGMGADSTAGKALTAYVNDLQAKAKNWNSDMDKEVDSGHGGKLKEIASTWATSTGGRADNDHMKIDAQKMLQRMIYIALTSVQDGFDPKNYASLDKITENKSGMFTITTNSRGLTLDDWKSKLQGIVGANKIDDAVKYCSPKEEESSNPSSSASNEQKYNCYKAIYDNLNNFGWSVEDTTSIQEKLKNGTYRLNGEEALENNTNLYEEDTSADATAKAEAYWKTEMGKINRKEKKLDQELTKLQTEYSSLTTDYESVKSIITQNIGKSFTYCQNG